MSLESQYANPATPPRAAKLKRNMQSGLEALSPRHAIREMREERKALWDNCCAYCGIKTHPKFLTIDHVVPKSQLEREFADMPTNLVPACEKCNNEKDDIDAFTWYRRQTFYTAERWAKIKG